MGGEVGCLKERAVLITFLPLKRGSGGWGANLWGGLYKRFTVSFKTIIIYRMHFNTFGRDLKKGKYIGDENGCNHQMTVIQKIEDNEQYPHHNTKVNQQWLPQHQEAPFIGCIFLFSGRWGRCLIFLNNFKNRPSCLSSYPFSHLVILTKKKCFFNVFFFKLTWVRQFHVVAA